MEFGGFPSFFEFPLVLFKGHLPVLDDDELPVVVLGRFSRSLFKMVSAETAFEFFCVLLRLSFAVGAEKKQLIFRLEVALVMAPVVLVEQVDPSFLHSSDFDTPEKYELMGLTFLWGCAAFVILSLASSSRL
jgi:hypothetical protein